MQLNQLPANDRAIK